MRGSQVRKIKTKVEFFHREEKILKDEKGNFVSGHLVTAFTASRSKGLHIIAGRVFNNEPTKEEVKGVKLSAVASVLKNSAIDGMAELVELIEEEKKRFK